VGYPGARCNYTNPAVVIARTADSALVICETGAGLSLKARVPTNQTSQSHQPIVFETGGQKDFQPSSQDTSR
jgi:hypothetical protein